MLVRRFAYEPQCASLVIEDHVIFAQACESCVFKILAIIAGFVPMKANLPAGALAHRMRWSRPPGMHDVVLKLPPPLLIRGAVAAVWFYEGLWCKVLGCDRNQIQVVQAVPKLGQVYGPTFLLALGLAECALGCWVLSGAIPGACAIAQMVLLVTLNVNGILWARKLIHDPAGMVIKNFTFLLLAWASAALGSGTS